MRLTGRPELEVRPSSTSTLSRENAFASQLSHSTFACLHSCFGLRSLRQRQLITTCQACGHARLHCFACTDPDSQTREIHEVCPILPQWRLAPAMKNATTCQACGHMRLHCLACIGPMCLLQRAAISMDRLIFFILLAFLHSVQGYTCFVN